MKILIAIIYLVTAAIPGWAQNSTPPNQASFVKQPEPPQYETCQMITVESGEGGSYQTQDHACLGRNAEKQRNYNASMEAYQRSLRIVSTDASTTARPQEPAYETCAGGSSGSWEDRDYACESRNSAARRDYEIQMMGWNRLQTEKQNVEQVGTAQENALIDEAKRQQSATDTLAKAQDLNNQSQQRSNTGAQITQMASAALAGAFAVSCMGFGATCNYGFLAGSIAMGILSAQSSKQAHQNAMQGYHACTAQQQLSGTQSTCSAVPDYNPTTGPTTTDVTSTFNPDGTCRVAQSTCDQVIAALPPGTNIRDAYRGASTFANGNAPFRINPDGSVTVKKTGKTIPANALNDPNAWAAAGIDPATMKAATSAANKLGASFGSGSLAGTGGSGSDKNASGSGSGYGTASLDGGSALDDPNALGANGKNGAGKFGSKGIGGSGDDALNGRKPAGQGLTRDFNGEVIGAAGDDIFSMMNRRYQMKTAQDTFINN